MIQEQELICGNWAIGAGERVKTNPFRPQSLEVGAPTIILVSFVLKHLSMEARKYAPNQSRNYSSS